MNEPSRAEARTSVPGLSVHCLRRLAGLVFVAALIAPAAARAARQKGDAPAHDPSEINTLLEDAQRALNRKDFAAAVGSLESVVKLQPDFFPAWFNLAYAYTALDQNDAAVHAYRKSLELKPDLYEAQLNLGILLMEMKRAPESVEYLMKASSLKPDDSRAHLYYGRALAQVGKNDEAEKEFRETLRLDARSVMAHFDLGQLYLGEKRYEPGRQSFEKAFELDPKLAQAELGLALAAEGLKMPEEAAKHFEQYLTAQPDDAETRFHLARIYLEEGKNDRALENLEKVEQAKPGLPGLAAARGDVYALLKKFPESEKAYRRAVEEAPQEADLHRALAQTLLDEEKFPEAETEFRAALKLDPGNREALKGLAASLYLQKRYAEAIPFYEAQAQSPDSPGTFFILALCYDHLQARPKALENYERYLELSHGVNPDQEWQARQRAKLLRKELKK